MSVLMVRAAEGSWIWRRRSRPGSVLSRTRPGESGRGEGVGWGGVLFGAVGVLGGVDDGRGVGAVAVSLFVCTSVLGGRGGGGAAAAADDGAALVVPGAVRRVASLNDVDVSADESSLADVALPLAGAVFRLPRLFSSKTHSKSASPHAKPAFAQKIISSRG